MCTAGGGRLGVRRAGCGAVGAFVVACTQDASMPVCESDGGAAAAVLVVAVVGERLRRLYRCWRALRWVPWSRHVGMWYTDGSRVSHATGSSKGYLHMAAHSRHTHTPWSGDGCRGLLLHTRPVSRMSQVLPSTIQGYSALTDLAVAPLH